VLVKAIVSDIHGNLEALNAVLADMARYEVEAVYCLGDIVGYGPNPRECLDIAMQWNVVLLGSMDLAATLDPLGPKASPSAADRSLTRCRHELNLPIPNSESVERRWRSLAERPHVHWEGNFQFVHGSPRNPLQEYIFPEDSYNCRKMQRIFASVDQYCFNGHTHIPGIFTEDKRFSTPADLAPVHQLDCQKAIVNVGSVGQPRDGDWRACYVLLDHEKVQFRRVEYDIEATSRKL
jgi:predicted phosphodiesterase